MRRLVEASSLVAAIVVPSMYPLIRKAFNSSSMVQVPPFVFIAAE
jgi:hypothetical protein